MAAPFSEVKGVGKLQQQVVSWGALTRRPVLRPLTVLTLDQPFGWLIRRLEKRGCFL